MFQDTETIIVVSSFGVAGLLLLSISIALCVMVIKLRKKVDNMSSVRIRTQKLKIDNSDKNHSFHNPTISPDEELSRRGYSMYQASKTQDIDVESAKSAEREERQTGGLMDELSRELDSRAQRQSAPPFLLQAIRENKKKTQNNLAQGRQSDTNPNFIY